MAERVDLVLFDLGGVLIEVAGVRAMLELTGIESEEGLWRRWLACRWVRRFESGGCSAAEFAAGVVADWQLELSPAAFLEAFQDWPTGPLPGAAELVAQTRASVATGCFSNTNALHWYGHIAAWPLAGLFDHRFLSFELGSPGLDGSGPATCRCRPRAGTRWPSWSVSFAGWLPAEPEGDGYHGRSDEQGDDVRDYQGQDPGRGTVSDPQQESDEQDREIPHRHLTGGPFLEHAADLQQRRDAHQNRPRRRGCCEDCCSHGASLGEAPWACGSCSPVTW